jgi:hypothetical protein
MASLSAWILDRIRGGKGGLFSPVVGLVAISTELTISMKFNLESSTI